MQDVLQDLTVSKVARELHTRRDGVVALLLTGELIGYDVSAPGAKRKSYRITREAVEQFKKRRTIASRKETMNTRRRVLKPTVREHI